MRKILLASTFLIALAIPAKADIVLFGLNDILSFRDLGAQGFGDAPRALTLQTNGLEVGARGFGNTIIDQAITGTDKGSTPTLGSLGWDNGLSVGIGFNTDQAGQKDGITMQALVLTVWNGTGQAVFTAHLAQPFINFSAAALALQSGNGNAVFDFELDAQERGEFNDMLAANPGAAAFTVGLASVLGCGTFGAQTFDTPGCLVADDGPDSFILFDQNTAVVPAPVLGAGLPGLITACLAMFGFARRRQQKIV